MRGVAGERAGQMSVELAALLPVMVVVAFAVYNLMRYVELCAQFDQVAIDAVVSQGVAPPGEQSIANSEREVRFCVEEAMGGEGTCEVEVRAEAVGRLGEGSEDLTVLPSLTRFTCTLKVRPWPSRLSVAGVELSPPALLVHERSLVVDRYRPGVVV